MTYFGFLLRFLVVPIILLTVAHLILGRRGRPLPESLRAVPAVPALLAHIVIALVYTTPWDNYLVATGVWAYNPDLVTGIVIGWVPIEEYTFFVLQPIMAGLWLFLMARLLPLGPAGNYARPSLRAVSTGAVILVWLVAVVVFFSGWAPGTYLSITLAWALPPIAIQLAVGADILWRYRGLVFWSIAPVTLYLSAADSLAIGHGTWTIDPGQSFNVFLGGVLPVEEFVFFALTNILLVFGMTLLLARETHERLRGELLPWLNARRRAPGAG